RMHEFDGHMGRVARTPTIAHNKEPSPVVKRFRQSLTALRDTIGLLSEKLLFSRHTLATFAHDFAAQVTRGEGCSVALFSCYCHQRPPIAPTMGSDISE